MLRAAVTGGDARSVIVKRHLAAGDSERSVREPAALSVLPQGQGFLELLGVGDHVIVLSDLGDGDQLSDLLLGADPTVAAEGVLAWADALGRLHRATRGSGAADTLAAQLPALNLQPDPAALRELRELDELLGGGPDARALTPTDACPDNNSFIAKGMVLLDFESAQWRHVAWDAAYRLVPWPSCWCSWQLPTEVSQAGLASWRAAIDLDYARTPHFDHDLRAVRTGWAVCSTAWFLERAIAGDHGTTERCRTGGR